MRVLVISHTAHYNLDNGTIVGWEPTVRELNALAEQYGEVVHIACLHTNKDAPANTMPYNDKIRFVAIKPFGGKGVINKFKIILSMFRNLSIISKEMKYADIFQFRAPTSIGLYIIPYLSMFCNKKGWYKYAGNWNQHKAPISYRVQRWMLSQQKRKVTINGKWENQPSNCASFENPCLYETDLEIGLKHVKNKNPKPPYRLCYVGNLSKEKGVYEILNALKANEDKACFSSLDIVGDGEETIEVERIAKTIRIPVKLHGSLKREDVFNLYKHSDFILLPSKSEGFPKVIAEAANFGCIPIVSNVSAIGQYVNSANGYLWDSYKETFPAFLSGINFLDTSKIQSQSINAHDMALAFTYANYIKKLDKEIISEVAI